ncbi:MAG TPA: type IV pilus twitching motility protein PilT [bacterium]|nr:type IV pilus twitching motility protein PilT [bacterium]
MNTPGFKLNMKTLFDYAYRVGASDLLITADAPPMVRVDGDLHPAVNFRLEPPHTKKLLWSIINETQQEMLERQRELDFSLSTSAQLRFRVNMYYQRGALAGAFRLIPNYIPKLEKLGLPPVVKEFALRQNGLILLTGPTGSGKSTTMASMLDLVNNTRRCHIITVEDPIEFVHENKLSIIDQREVYSDTHSFRNALKYVLREDPDVILIGEMRDQETIAAALTAAETGHLVIATLHTNDAVQSIDRIIDVFTPHQQAQIRTQLAFTLIAIISQQLVPRKDGNGRILACELLIKNNAVGAHIRDGKTHQTRSVMETGRQEGMQTLDKSLQDLYSQGLITFDELSRRVSSRLILREMMKSISKEEADALKQGNGGTAI